MKKKTRTGRWKNTTAKQRSAELRNVWLARWQKRWPAPAVIDREHPGYTVPEVAELLGVRALTVRRWIAARSLAAFKPGTTYRFVVPASEVIRILEERRAALEQRAATLRQRRAEVESIGKFSAEDFAP